VDVQTEDSALILFRTANDIAGSAVISQLSAGRKNRLWIEVDGMHQSAVFDQEQPEQLWVGSEAGAYVLVRDPSRGSAEQRRLSTLPAGHAQGYANASRTMSPIRTPPLTPMPGMAKCPTDCPPSQTGLGLRRSVTRCCGQRRLGSGSTSASVEMALAMER
jgi:predicted dehydrogenase